ncbi:MAG: hypothetical protein IKE34_12560, partial [Paenibacillus sp.]|nr:hypothetical protein [Paenibacillus sp.]
YIDFYLIGELVDSHGNVHYEDLKNLPTANVVPMEYHERCVTEEIRKRANLVEVVRCCDADKGDCMFNHWHETPNGEKYHICNLNQLSFSEHADFFCAYGERREDDKG